MIVAPSNEAIGNEQQTKLPSVKTENGSFNEEYLQQLGDYFSTHYALRPQIMSADAEIQSKVFGVSNVDTVTAEMTTGFSILQRLITISAEI